MTLVLLIVGSGRNVGKTLLGETIARLASSKGLRVWVVKHVHHGVDYRVKDTGRYLSAGAERVYAIGAGETMIVERRVHDLGEVKRAAESQGVDLLIVEGFKNHIETLKPDITVCIGFRHERCTVNVEPYPAFDPAKLAQSIFKGITGKLGL